MTYETFFRQLYADIKERWFERRQAKDSTKEELLYLIHLLSELENFDMEKVSQP